MTEHLIPHRYFNASDDPAAYAADEVDRQAVTAIFAYERLTDEPLWFFSHHRSQANSDPWREIGGMDQIKQTGEIVLEFGRTSELCVPRTARVFVARATLRRLGWAEGQRGGPPLHWEAARCPVEREALPVDWLARIKASLPLLAAPGGEG